MTPTVEPRRLWPCLDFAVMAAELQKSESRIGGSKGRPVRFMRIPFAEMGADAANPGPLRINVRVTSKQGQCDWIVPHPLESRLLLGGYNPADLGWLVFEKENGGRP
jgi:hypothetical protein